MTSEPVHQHWSSPVTTPTTCHSHLSVMNNSSPSFTTPVSTTSATNDGSHNSPANATPTMNSSDMFALTTNDTVAQGIF